METKTASVLAAVLILGAPFARGEEPLPPVVVTAAREGSWEPDALQLGGGDPVLRVPASVTVFTRAALGAQGQRTLADLTRRDALAADAYAPVGYYQNVSLRGFPLDPGTGYKIDGLTVVGEQAVALENKSRLEVWNGAAGMEAGATSPGGAVNYAVARPAPVRSLTLGTDARGGSYAALDAGFVLSDGRTGLRVNAAHEDLRPPVRHAEGRRNFASLAADWGFAGGATLRADAEYQRRVQDSVPGYQLLGGTALPPLPDPSRLLGWQPWTRPVAINSLNASLAVDAALTPSLSLRAAAGRSEARIDDNIAFPYGCGSLSTFCADGSYEIYDFRSSGERRRADDAVLSLTGKGRTRGVAQRWSAGVEYFARAVDMSSWIYDPAGSDNIFNPDPAVVPPSTAGAPVARRVLDHRQRSLFARDAATLGRWTLRAGARLTLARETVFDAGTGAETARRRATRVLPEAAVVYAWKASSAYASYAEGLELGGVAPAGSGNAQAVMPARVARQAEAGVKARVGRGLLLGAALFRAVKPYEFLDAANDWVQRGREVHDGLELSAAGRAARGVNLHASAAYLSAVQRGTGEPGYDGQAVPNVPRVQAAVFADADLPWWPGAGLFAGWRFSSSKAVLPSGGPRLPSWQVFDAGARWSRPVGRARLSLRLAVDNLFDARYWRDASQQYLFTGLPRDGRLTATLEF